MDSCPFVRLIVESLALKLPPVSKPVAGREVHPSTNPCFCTMHLQDYPTVPPQTALLPLATSSSNPLTLTETPDPISLSSPVVFSIDKTTKTWLKKLSLIVSVYSGRTGGSCGFSGKRMLGRVRVGVDVEMGMAHAVVMQSGWVSLGSGASVARLHLVVRSEPDPRFVFEFGGEPECSPVVYQVQGGPGSGGGLIRQPVFSCRFSTDRRRTTRSRSLPPESSRGAAIRTWLTSSSRKSSNLRSRDQRKGWTVTIHDLSGSPVAAASMVTPFVPSPGSDRVSRSNPGAWLILRPTGFSTTNWKPWARFEAWRERGPIDALGYKFELVTDNGLNSGLLIAESAINVKKGGYFKIDPSVGGEIVSRSWPFVGGFVMESMVEGEGKVSKPTVHVGLQHVTSTGDVALFVALAAAVDLSMDACRLFSQKLRKELTCDQQQDQFSL